MSVFSFTVQLKLEWLVVPKDPVWKKRRFVTIRLDGPWASLADLPSVFRTHPRSVITGKELRKSELHMSLVRFDDDFVSVESLLKEAYENHPDIYKDLERGLQGYVWATSVEKKTGKVTESFYTVFDGELSVGSRITGI